MKDNYFYFDDKYRKLQAEKTRMAWQLGLHDGKRARVEERKCKKVDCSNLFKIKYFDPKQFCSQNCAATYNNLTRGILNEEWRKKISLSMTGKPNKFKGQIITPRLEKICPACSKKFLIERWQKRKYCSINCWSHILGSRPTSPKAARAKAGIRPDIDPNLYFFSRWEANYARILNLLKIKWQFQPKTFNLKTQKYTPDFYLLDEDTYIEIKNFLSDYSAKRDKEFRELNPNIKLKLILRSDYLKLQEQFSPQIQNWEFS